MPVYLPRSLLVRRDSAARLTRRACFCLEAEALRAARSAIHNVCKQPIRDLCHG